MKLNSHKDLIVWQKSMLLVKEAYELTFKLPASEQYGLSSQIQRAAVAIPSNIAEGYGRQHNKEYLQFISIAKGSSCELETQLLICKDIYFSNENSIEFDKCLNLLIEIQKMLNRLSTSLKLSSTP